MNQLFDRLFDSSTSKDGLDSFLNENIQAITDSYNCEYESIIQYRDTIERFILLKAGIIEQLDYNHSYNKAFISMLLDLCERFSLYAATPRIYDVLEKNQIVIGHRLQAALLYLYNIDCNSRLIERFEEICENLQISLEEEEDNNSKILATFLNYYATVLLNTPLEYGTKLKLKIQESVDTASYIFFQDKSIYEALTIDISNPNIAFIQIQSIIDKILNKSGQIKHIIPDLETLLIEQGTEYCELIKHVNRNFKSIRKVSIDIFKELSDKNEIYLSLGRGVAILENDKQMYSYMNSYGSVHQAKMLSALEFVNFSSITNNIEVFDWSCGQGLASIVLLDYLKTKRHPASISKITLIEPSIICLKRAALHITTFDNSIKLSTICKDLDSIALEDIKSNPEWTKVHLFSNILDVETFSLSRLIEKIDCTQKGVNFFICVSPYITDAKTDRVESFMRYFVRKNGSYHLLGEGTNGGRMHDTYWCCNNKFNNCMCAEHPHTCNGEKKWTRIIRVFKVDL